MEEFGVMVLQLSVYSIAKHVDILPCFVTLHTMRLIQAKVSDGLFRAFSHHLVDEDLTVSEVISGWIEMHCGSGLVEVPGKATIEEQVDLMDRPSKVSPKTKCKPLEEYLAPGQVGDKKCAGCGKVLPDNWNSFFCEKCQKP